MKTSLLIAITVFIFTQPLFCQTVLNQGDSLRRGIVLSEYHKYSVATQKGDVIELRIDQIGIDLSITISSVVDSVSELFDSPNGVNGPEPVFFESKFTGNYSVIVEPLNDSINNEKSGNYIIKYLKKNSAAEYQELLKQKEAEEKVFISWLKTNAVKLKSVIPESGFEDLNVLKNTLSNKRVIGLGEATHGTREFFQMKHRMLEFLVKEMGFNVFAIEASYSRCKYINEYVLNGKGSLDTAVVIQGFVPWSTEEVRDMIKWIKDYNDVNSGNKIQFVGYDLQVNDAAAYDISKFYGKVELQNKSGIDSLLLKVLDAEKKGGAFSGDTTIISLLKPIEDLIINLIEKKGQYLLSVTEEEYEESLWNHRILHQFIISFTSNNFMNILKYDPRDFYMAQNIFSWLAYFPKETKIVIWAHNAHIANNVFGGASSQVTMGSYLKKELKDEYYAIGFDFYKGKFQANDVDLKNSPGWEEHEVTEAPKGNLSNYFIQAGLHDSFVDFTLTDKSKTIDKWINENETGMYFIGSQFSKNWPASYYTSQIKLNKEFDGIIFIEESNRAIPVKRMRINKYKID